jgi:hypothetical protein
LQASTKQPSCIDKQNKYTFLEKTRKQTTAFIIVCNAAGKIKEE